MVCTACYSLSSSRSGLWEYWDESEYELPNNLTAHQWRLSIVALFEALTRQVSSSDVLASDMTPAVTMLHRLLSKETDRGRHRNSEGNISCSRQETIHRRGKKNTLLHCNCTRSEVVRVCQSVFSNISTATEAKKMVVPELQKVFLKPFLEL